MIKLTVSGDIVDNGDNGSQETRKRGDDLRKGFDPNAKRTTTIRIGIALCCAA